MLGFVDGCKTLGDWEVSVREEDPLMLRMRLYTLIEADLYTSFVAQLSFNRTVPRAKREATPPSMSQLASSSLFPPALFPTS